MKITVKGSFWDKLFLIVSWFIILAGSVTRIIVWLQNRNLFIDEANVARNIYERNLIGLAKPLAYEQYAPPVFLWITKLNALLFGYSEPVLRILPVLSGIGVLIVLYFLLKQLVSLKTIWYPLALLAVSYILIRYSSELKQYMTDAFVVLCILLMALKTDLLQKKNLIFGLQWGVAGSIAIWASMPSVFALAGVGCYYLFLCIQSKKYQKIVSLVIVTLLWIAQFAAYYFIILKPQANSNYLQNFHQGYFMFLLPGSKDQLMHNWYLFRNLLQETSGYAGLSWKINTIFFSLGIIMLLWKQTARGLLIVVPVVATLLAAALHQYSLIPRVAIFLMPLILILIGCGFDAIMSIKFFPLQLLLVIFGIRVIRDHSMLIPMIKDPYKFEVLTEELTFLQQHNISGEQLYIHNGTVPAFIYYTEIHPKKQQWKAFINSHRLTWDCNLDSLAKNIQMPAAFIYTSLSAEELQSYKERIGRYLTIDTFIEADQRRCFVYIYKR